MTISNHSLLKKMEDEIMKANQLKESGKIREHVYTIKTLCELLLDQEESDMIEHPPTASPATVTAVSINKSQPLKTDDGANGDSIFDF